LSSVMPPRAAAPRRAGPLSCNLALGSVSMRWGKFSI
jgi:hypothetical protein